MKWQSSPTLAGAAAMILITVLPWTGRGQSASDKISEPSTPLKLTTPNTPLRPANGLAGQDVPPNTPQLSPWTAEIVKLARADIEENVLFTFIDNAGTFNLGADQIIHLHELGVSSELLIAMIQHDAELISGCRPLTSSTTPSFPASIQIVLVPATNAPSNGSSPPAAWNGVHEDSNSPTPSDLEYPATDQNEPTLSAPQQAPTLASKEKEKLYRVRQPYPEQVMAPIIVFRSAGLTPNTLLIEFSP